jgi:hypothetical protein
MRKFIAFFAAVLILGAGGIAMASDTSTQTVTYEVTPINELSVTGNPGALIVNAAVAGAAPTAVSDASSSYAITTNETYQKDYRCHRYRHAGRCHAHSQSGRTDGRNKRGCPCVDGYRNGFCYGYLHPQ